MGIQPYNKAQMGSLPGSDRRYVDQELLKIQTAIQSVENAFGAWTAYTPVVSASSGTITAYTATGRYQQIGKLVILHVDVTITTNGTGAGAVNISLPVTPGSTTIYLIPGKEHALVGKALTGVTIGSNLSVVNYDNTYPGANGYRLLLTGPYESA